MDATSTIPADPAIHLVIGHLSGVGVQPGGWLACDPFGVRPNPPLTQRTRDRQQATCPTCLSAVDPYPSLGDPHYEAEKVHADDSHEAYLETALIDALWTEGRSLSEMCGDAAEPLRDSEGEKVGFDTVTTLFDAGMPAAERGVMVTLTDGTQFAITVRRRPLALPQWKTALISAAQTGQLMAGHYVSQETITVLVGKGYGTYITDGPQDGIQSVIGFRINENGQEAARRISGRNA